jgi:hypothetical protein
MNVLDLEREKLGTMLLEAGEKPNQRTSGST